MDGSLHMSCFFPDFRNKDDPRGNEGCFLYMYVEHLYFDQMFGFFLYVPYKILFMYAWILTFPRYKAKEKADFH